jgi:hypothetical protein
MFEDVSNIVQLLHIVELKVGPQEERQEQIIIIQKLKVRKDSKMQFGEQPHYFDRSRILYDSICLNHFF